MRMRLTNDFHETETIIDLSIPLTNRRIRDIKKRLCPYNCKCGDVLGTRGKQPKGYEDFCGSAFAILHF